MSSQPPTEPQVAIQIRVPASWADALREIAAANHRTVPGEIRRLISAEVENGARERQAA